MIPLKQNNLGWRESLAPSLMTRILVPTDLTDDSRIAIWYAIGLARRARAKLTLLHVWDNPTPAWPPSSPYYHAELELDGRRMLAESEEAESALRSMRDWTRALYSATEDCFLIGETGSLVLRAAKDLASDLLSFQEATMSA